MEGILKYIDAHLKEELTVQRLAREAGFSPYHFCRVFQGQVGLGAMEYVRARRLAFAAVELATGRRIIDIALDYGFETHSGFGRAFRRHYGVSPEAYRAHKDLLGNPPPLPSLAQMHDYDLGGIVMEARIQERGPIRLLGYTMKTSVEKGENSRDIPNFWGKYLQEGLMTALHNADCIQSHAEYGACLPGAEDSPEFEYIIGVELKEGCTPPADFETRELPAATYAVFSTPPSDREHYVANIQGLWRYIFAEWLPASDYEYDDGKVDFEYYDDRSMGDKDLVCDVYIPVRKKR